MSKKERPPQVGWFVWGFTLGAIATSLAWMPVSLWTRNVTLCRPDPELPNLRDPLERSSGIAQPG